LISKGSSLGLSPLWSSLLRSGIFSLQLAPCELLARQFPAVRFFRVALSLCKGLMPRDGHQLMKSGSSFCHRCRTCLTKPVHRTTLRSPGTTAAIGGNVRNAGRCVLPVQWTKPTVQDRQVFEPAT